MSAEEIRLTAGRWLERSKRADWSAEDQSELDLWLTEPSHLVAYLRIESIWQSTDRLTVLRAPKPMRVQRPQSNLWPNLRKAAAGLAIAGVIGSLAWQQATTPRQDTYVTAIGEHKTVTFQDGTSIEINTDTVLRVSQSATERKAWLDKGEAYFEVEHDSARPFIVIAQGRKVTDLGTKFAVRQTGEKLHVTVVEGLVEVEAKGAKPQSLLKPGDILTATANSQSVSKKTLPTILAGLDWKHGKLFLDYATLAEAAAEFNRYNSRKLVIADPKVAELTIVGTYQTRNLDKFITATKELFGLKAKTSEDQIILSR